MKKFKANFCFKGNRDYIHGSDIYNNIFNILKKEVEGRVKPVDLMIHKIATTNLDGRLGELNDFPKLQEIIATCRFVADGKKYLLDLRENGEAIECRYDYPEEIIANNSSISEKNKSIYFNNQTDFSAIEIIVALNKALLHDIFSTIKGKWYFTRLTLSEELPNPSNALFEIVFDRSLGTRLTRSKIIINKQHVGIIYFSLV